MKPIQDLKTLQSIEIDILKKIHSFCVNNKIEYMLCFGTLLGAIRHSGFIPWDDDIDIYMTRPNYEVFLEKFKTIDTNTHLEIANDKTNNHLIIRPMTKIFDNRTMLFEPDYKYDMPYGVFIDIWPIDGLPNNKKLILKHYKKLFRLKKLLYASNLKFKRHYSFSKKLAIAFSRFFINPKKICNKFENLCKKYPYDKSENVACLLTQCRDKTWYKKADIENLILKDFEDARFYVPSNYDKILKIDYGDYLTLPPKDKQVPHHIMNTYIKDEYLIELSKFVN